MWPSNDRIGETELVILIASTLIGSGIVTLPAILAAEVGPDAWLSVLFAWVIALFAGTAVTQVMRQYPHQSVMSILEQTWGVVVARIIGAAYTLYGMFITGVTVGIASDQIKLTLLPLTPYELIAFSILLLAAYVAREGLEPMARMLTLLFPVIFLPITVLGLSLKGARLEHFLPVLGEGIGPVMKGSLSAMFTFLGFELLYVVANALRNPQTATRAVIKGISITGVVYLTIILVTTTIFTRAQAAALVVPLKSIIDTIDLPFVFLERFDVFIFALWITVSYTTILAQVYGVSRFLQETCGLRSQTPAVLPVVPIAFTVSILPESTLDLTELVELANNIGLIFGIVIPVSLWAALGIRRRWKAWSQEAR